MDCPSIPFRIRIGVAGHRVLSEPQRIAAAIRELLCGRVWELFSPRLPQRQRITPLVYSVLTPLAEGADRLVAREILKTSRAELEVVLPLAKEDYLRGFAGADSEAEFEEIFRQARHVLALKTRPLTAAGDAAEGEEERKRAYEQVGRYIVDHSDVLIAVWDGKPPRGRGGTAETVAYARERRLPLIIVSSVNPSQTIVEKGTGLSGRTYDRIRMFNQCPMTENEQHGGISKTYQDLFSTPEGERHPAPAKTAIRETLIPWYVKASLVARRNQKRYFRSGSIVFALSPAAVAAVALGILVPAWALTVFLFELVVLLTIYGVIKMADRSQVHKKWIEARFLAERIRSAIFLFCCGLKPAAISISPFMKQAFRAEEWTIRTFDEIMAAAGRADAAGRGDCAACVSFVRARWIGTQIEFHALKAAKAGRLARLLEKAGRAIFLAAVGASTWHLASLLLGHHGFFPDLDKPAVFMAVVLPALGAAVGGARAHREYSRLAQRSRSMEAALRDLDRRLTAVTDFDGLEGLLRETEQLMLQETEDWRLLMKFSSIEAI